MDSSQLNNVEELLSADDSIVSIEIKEQIRNWNTPATALQVYDTLNYAVRHSACSTMMLTLLNAELADVLAREGISYMDVASTAMTRDISNRNS